MLIKRDKINSINFNSLSSNLTSVVQSKFNQFDKNTKIIAKGDSGATNHYLRDEHKKNLDNVQSGLDRPLVQLPNNDVIETSSTGILNLHPALSMRAKEAHILPQLGTSLISLGQLADDGCVIMLDKAKLRVFKNYTLLLTGTQNLRDGLWDIPLLPHTPQQYHSSAPLLHKSNVIIPRNKSARTLIQYLHATLYSPTKSTLLTAVQNGDFPTWPGFTVDNVVKFWEETPATALGHLDQEKQCLQSSKELYVDIDFFPTTSNSPNT